MSNRTYGALQVNSAPRTLCVFCARSQDFRVGYQSKTGQEQESSQASNLTNNTDTNKM